MKLLDDHFREWESALTRNPMSVRVHKDGGVELRPQPSPDERLDADAIEERWAQQYVKEEFSRLGFTKVEGPFRRGPDFQVFGRRRWRWAEVETRWQNYFQHDHHMNPSFDNVECLILLSAEPPPQDRLQYLPQRVFHIDQDHFLAWYTKAAGPELLGKEFGVRIAVVAMAMQQYWATICSDADREMSTCPNCDSCAYFGSGRLGEAGPFYQSLAAKFLMPNGVTVSGRADLRKVKATDLERFVEQHCPGA